MEQSRNTYRVLVGKPEGKRHLGRPRCRWEDNIKMDLWETGCDPGEWTHTIVDISIKTLAHSIHNLANLLWKEINIAYLIMHCILYEA